MKPFKTRSEPILKNVIVKWYAKMTENHKRKPIKSIRIKDHLDFSSMYPLGTKYFINKKHSFQKDF
jgi:hypothetical protein